MERKWTLGCDEIQSWEFSGGRQGSGLDVAMRSTKDAAPTSRQWCVAHHRRILKLEPSIATTMQSKC